MDRWTMRALPRPDFVIAGGHLGGNEGVLIFASKELTEAEILSEAKERTTFFKRELIAGVFPEYEYVTYFRVQMKKYVMVWGRTYAEAFSTLFKEWSPDDHEQEGAGRLYAPGRFGTDETGAPRGLGGPSGARSSRGSRLSLPAAEAEGGVETRREE